jgi:crotonobetainyl-CoA:carnitine CoA-transferase CaiB-like acyl-CoA transferase
MCSKSSVRAPAARAADLDLEHDQARLRRLIGVATVVVDNFRSGTLAKRQLDASELLAKHPQLIWCMITGRGALVRAHGWEAFARV